MSAEWMPWNHGWFRIKPRRRKHDAEVKMTKKEKRALMKGAFSAMLPMLLTITGVFLLMFLLAFIWLMP